MTDLDSIEAAMTVDDIETIQGMVGFCINKGYCLGMDEGVRYDMTPKNQTKRLSAFSEIDPQAILTALKAYRESACDGDYFDTLTTKARQAAEKAMIKFPQPNYVALKIAEEAGEVVRGCVHYAEGRLSWEDVEGEIIQLMAMLYRLINEGDEVNGVLPPAPKQGDE